MQKLSLSIIHILEVSCCTYVIAVLTCHLWCPFNVYITKEITRGKQPSMFKMADSPGAVELIHRMMQLNRVRAPLSLRLHTCLSHANVQFVCLGKLIMRIHL